MEKEALLTTSANPFQRSVIEGVLRDAGIAFRIQESPAPTAYLGSGSPLAYEEFRVSPDDLQKAKDVLCLNGVVCEVSGRLLHRSIEEIVKPLLFRHGDDGSRGGDLGRLLRFVEINNKETVRALFEATLREQNGRELLEELFFLLARGESPMIRILARALHKQVNAAFGDRLLAEAVHGQKKLRLALLSTIPDLPDTPDRVRTLAAALRDRDGEIREAGSEALFALGGEDHGYDPEDAPAEREQAVQKLLASAGL